MRKMYTIPKLLYLLILFCLLQSCKSDEKKVEVLKKDVIAIHDEVMPRMDDLMDLKEELQEAQKNLDSTASQEKRRTIQRHLVYLDKADEEMMNWMRKYDPQMENMTEQEKLIYLEAQKIAIQMVRQEMLSAIAESEQFFKSETEGVIVSDSFQ